MTLTKMLHDDYLRIYFPIESVTYSVVASLEAGFLLIGFVLNLIGLFYLIKVNSTKRASHFFLINLVVVDLLSVVLNSAMTLSSTITRRWLFEQTGCAFYGYASAVFGFVSVLTMLFMSIERYLVIRNPLNSLRISCKIILGCIGFAWTYAFLLLLPGFFTPNGFVLDGLLTWCSLDYMGRDLSTRGFLLFVGLLGCALPMLLLGLVQLRIWPRLRRTKTIKFYHHVGVGGAASTATTTTMTTVAAVTTVATVTAIARSKTNKGSKTSSMADPSVTDAAATAAQPPKRRGSYGSTSDRGQLQEQRRRLSSEQLSLLNLLGNHYAYYHGGSNTSSNNKQQTRAPSNSSGSGGSGLSGGVSGVRADSTATIPYRVGAAGGGGAGGDFHAMQTFSNCFMRREIKASKFVLLNAIAFCTAWVLPFVSLAFSAQLADISSSSSGGSGSHLYVTPYMRALLFLVGRSTVVLSPLIYTLIHGECRRYFVQALVGACSAKSNGGQPEASSVFN